MLGLLCRQLRGLGLIPLLLLLRQMDLLYPDCPILLLHLRVWRYQQQALLLRLLLDLGPQLLTQLKILLAVLNLLLLLH